jgi:hypothetical protein
VRCYIGSWHSAVRKILQNLRSPHLFFFVFCNYL